MKIHLRFDRSDDEHAHMTLFVNGQNNGTLCTSPAEAIWLNHILSKGAVALSPKDGRLPIEFRASGVAPQPSEKQMDDCVQK